MTDGHRDISAAERKLKWDEEYVQTDQGKVSLKETLPSMISEGRDTII